MTLEPHASFPDLRLAAVRVCEGRHLPCWEATGAVYHVSCHLADSVPAQQMRAWQDERARLTALAQSEGRALTLDERESLKMVFDERVERYLSAGYGSCLLRRPDAQQMMKSVLTHDNGRLYALHAWSVMPNHFHVVVGSFDRLTSMRDVVSTWKHVSAHRINALCGRKGEVWNEDAYTRIIRDREEYERQVSYVWHNPDAAGLKDGFLRERYV